MANPFDLAGIEPGSTPASVDPLAIERFGWAQGPTVLGLSLLTVLLVSYYGITRAQHTNILKEVNGRAAASAPGNP